MANSTKQLVFLDESGNVGSIDKQGSSHFFVVSLVIFDSDESAQKCDQTIVNLRKSLRLYPNYEFHFAKNSEKIRLAFLSQIANQDFKIITICIDKSHKNFVASLSGDKNSFYKYACYAVLLNAVPHLDNAILTMDKVSSNSFYGEFRRHLRTEMNDPNAKIIKRIKPQDSQTNNLLQLVDYCVGIYARKAQQKKSWGDYHKFIKNKEVSFQDLP
jgi:hypothetical protein